MLRAGGQRVKTRGAICGGPVFGFPALGERCEAQSVRARRMVAHALRSGRSLRFGGRPLHVSALDLHVFLKSPAGVIDRLIDRRVGIVIVVIVVTRSIDDDLTARNHQIDRDPNRITRVVMPVRHLDLHVAARDSLREALELARPFANVRLERIGMSHIVKADGDG